MRMKQRVASVVDDRYKEKRKNEYTNASFLPLDPVQRNFF